MDGQSRFPEPANVPPSQPRADRTALRASDADRERVATLLREHYSEGRLTVDEFQERLERTYAARTLGELDVLTADLPVAAPPPSEPHSEVRHDLRARLAGYAVISVFLILIWALTGLGYFWPIWPILGLGLALSLRALGVHSSSRERRRGRRRRYR